VLALNTVGEVGLNASGIPFAIFAYVFILTCFALIPNLSFFFAYFLSSISIAWLIDDLLHSILNLSGMLKYKKVGEDALNPSGIPYFVRACIS
jgi:hypothetical protein